jgi:Bardet-Biedl syndrome 4 protein
MNLDSRAKINEAKEYFKRAITNGKQIQSYKKLAAIYRKDKDYPKAIELLESSLQ